MTPHRKPSRRDVLRTTTKLAAASALAGVMLPQVHAADTSMIEVALIGAGGRGTGAAADALSTEKQGPIKLVAISSTGYGHLERISEVAVSENVDGARQSPKLPRLGRKNKECGRQRDYQPQRNGH